MNVFREASRSSGPWNLFKSVVQMLVFWTVFLVVLPAVIYVAETSIGWERFRFAGFGFQIAGVVLFLLGSCLGVSSCLVMALRGQGTPLPLDCARLLVVVGPYRFIRNPMAVAGIAQGIAVGWFLGSPSIVCYALLGGPCWHILVRPAEEQNLEERFEESYRRYRAAVSCWVPRFPGYVNVTSTTKLAGEPPNADASTSEGQEP